MTSDGLGEMFKGDYADTLARKFSLVSMGGRAEGLACAEPGARTPIGVSGNFDVLDYSPCSLFPLLINCQYPMVYDFIEQDMEQFVRVCQKPVVDNMGLTPTLFPRFVFYNCPEDAKYS